MSITETDSVDAIGIDKISGEVVLTVSDHLDWNDVAGHCLALQSKLNTYLAFVEGGEMLESYPKAVGKAVRIEIVGEYPLIEEAQRFLERVEHALKDAGFTLAYRMLGAERERREAR